MIRNEVNINNWDGENIANEKQRMLLLISACLAGLSSFLFFWLQTQNHEYFRYTWFLFSPVSASCVGASLPRMFGLHDWMTHCFMGLIVLAGWYCPITLLFSDKGALSKKVNIFCIIGVVLIWLLPIVGYIVSKCE